MATHSSILAWRIPWTEKPGGLQSTGLQRVRHDWAHGPGGQRFTVLSPKWTALNWVLRTFLTSLSGEPWLLHTQPFPATEGTAILLMPVTTCGNWNGPDAAAQPQRQTWRKQERLRQTVMALRRDILLMWYRRGMERRPKATGQCVLGHFPEKLPKKQQKQEITNSQFKKQIQILFNRMGFPGGSDYKESACNARDMGCILGSRRSPKEGHGNPLQNSCLENPMDRGASHAAVHGVAVSDTT